MCASLFYHKQCAVHSWLECIYKGVKLGITVVRPQRKRDATLYQGWHPARLSGQIITLSGQLETNLERDLPVRHLAVFDMTAGAGHFEPL